MYVITNTGVYDEMADYPYSYTGIIKCNNKSLYIYCDTSTYLGSNDYITMTANYDNHSFTIEAETPIKLTFNTYSCRTLPKELKSILTEFKDFTHDDFMNYDKMRVYYDRLIRFANRVFNMLYNYCNEIYDNIDNISRGDNTKSANN